eukprot:COSAG02_NODE_4_length_69935_cov_46.806590_23_plen_765_part_00
MLLRRVLPRLPAAACVHRHYCRAAAASGELPERRNALKLLQGLLKKGGGAGGQRGWSRPRTGPLSPEVWALVENLAGKRQLKAAHCTAVLSVAATPAEVGRIARLADDAGLESDLPVVRTLFGAWCRCGHFEYAVAVLQDAVERGMVDQQQARILATKPLAAVARKTDNSWKFFRLLQAANLADRFHYNIMLPSCTPVGTSSAGVSEAPRCQDRPTVALLLADFQESGESLSTDTFNTRLKFAADTSGASEGWRDSARAAAALVAEMRSSGVMPDAATYSILHTCYLGASPTPSAAAAADVLAEARTVVPREFSATEISSTATVALRGLRSGDSPDLAWEYFSALQVGGIADGHHLGEVMHLCEDTEELDALVAQATLTSNRINRRRDASNGALEIALHKHLVRLGAVKRAAVVITDFARAKYSEPYTISTSITAALRELCRQSSTADAWEYFGAIQQRELADTYHYNTMLQQCNTVDGVERLLSEMTAAGLPRDAATTRALHMTWAKLGEPSRAFSELAAGIEAGAWSSPQQRERVVRSCLTALLDRDALDRDDVLFAYLSRVEDHQLLRPQCSSSDAAGAVGVSAPSLLSDEPYATLLRPRTEEDTNDQKTDGAFLERLVDHVCQRPTHVVMDGRGAALLLRRAAACCAPSLAARVLRSVKTDRVSRSKLATATLRGLAAAGGPASDKVTQLLQELIDDGIADTYQYNIGLRYARDSATVAAWVDSMVKGGHGDRQTLHLLHRNWGDIALQSDWQRSVVGSG